jgi:transcriptional regulator with GAF, ATPase, and Fis domain
MKTSTAEYPGGCAPTPLLPGQLRAVPSRPETRRREPKVTGSSPALQGVLDAIAQVAATDSTVLLLGETGTGKEIFASRIHAMSTRRARAMVRVNCAAIPTTLIENELFGRERGAYTGAESGQIGRFELANRSTIFLDEIGDLPADVQVKLLRVLEERQIERLGSPKPIRVDTRIIAATHRNLEQRIADGAFREDLFYRLNVVRLQVPPLRERREEIPALVQHYLDRCSRESQKTGLRLADETMEYLILYRWPGNVRQLANEVRRMVALAESGAVLMPEHLSQPIASSRRTIPTTERYLAPTEFVVRVDQPMSAALEHVERSMIQYALKLSGGRLEDAAHRLGLSRKGLYLKRQRLGLGDTEGELPPSTTSPMAGPADLPQPVQS